MCEFIIFIIGILQYLLHNSHLTWNKEVFLQNFVQDIFCQAQAVACSGGKNTAQMLPSGVDWVERNSWSTVGSEEDEARDDGHRSHSSWPIRQRPSNLFRLRRSPKRVHRLWQFLWTLLEDPTYNPSIIRWVDKEAKMFELTKSSVVANLWGAQKQKPGMSYENLGRSLR
ncbi:unnamed protein product [Schistocephalus solidus]|uniref:ETS domain-containing protein n=1 Tax=Schistocephalus solidus TaxID=70667 RepID=A0A3P7EH33_SCHSO|nr:unnamed protein product [Schistocephalus solidus]